MLAQSLGTLSHKGRGKEETSSSLGQHALLCMLQG